MSGRVWRRRTLMTIPALLTIAIIVYVCSSIIAFANIFGLFKPHSGVQITQKDIADAHTIKTDLWEPVVPKIIHQIYHNWHDANEDTLRPDWAVARKTCIDLHPGWQHIVSIHQEQQVNVSEIMLLLAVDHQEFASVHRG